MKAEFHNELSALKHLVRDVHHFGTYGINAKGSYRFFADGLVGLAWCRSNSQLLFNNFQPHSLFLYGQTVKPLEMKYEGEFELIVFNFQPYAIRYLFGIDASSLTDGCLDFDNINKQLRFDLDAADGLEERMRIIVRYLMRVDSTRRHHTPEGITYATNAIMSKPGEISLSALQKEICMSERTFERQFLRTVGVTPSTFTRICRFNEAICTLKKKKYNSLSDVAYHAGYSDQSHFIRQFREFTQVTPGEFVAGLTENQSSFSH